MTVRGVDDGAVPHLSCPDPAPLPKGPTQVNNRLINQRTGGAAGGVDALRDLDPPEAFPLCHFERPAVLGGAEDDVVAWWIGGRGRVNGGNGGGGWVLASLDEGRRLMVCLSHRPFAPTHP